jgi:hypothetical protein
MKANEYLITSYCTPEKQVRVNWRISVRKKGPDWFLNNWVQNYLASRGISCFGITYVNL